MKKKFMILLILFLCFSINAKGATTTGTFTPKVLNLTIDDPYPANNSVNVVLDVTLNITCTSLSGYLMNISWYENTSGSWLLIQQNLSINNGTYTHVFVNASNYSTMYWWKIAATDGMGNTNNKTFCFSTHALSCSFTYEVTGSTITTTPTITGATHYKWTIENIAETEWIPIADIYDQQFVFPEGGKYKITLTAKDDGASVYYARTVTVRVSPALIEPEPSEEKISEEKKPRLKNVFTDTGLSDWLEDRNIGEFMLIGITGFFIFFIVFKRRQKKLVVYPIKKNK